jgi:hypothetical protein
VFSGNGDNLLQVRNNHLCAQHKDFETNFRSLYRLSDTNFIENSCLNFKLDDDFDATLKLEKFVEDVSKPLTKD